MIYQNCRLHSFLIAKLSLWIIIYILPLKMLGRKLNRSWTRKFSTNTFLQISKWPLGPLFYYGIVYLKIFVGYDICFRDVFNDWHFKDSNLLVYFINYLHADTTGKSRGVSITPLSITEVNTGVGNYVDLSASSRMSCSMGCRRGLWHAWCAAGCPKTGVAQYATGVGAWCSTPGNKK